MLLNNPPHVGCPGRARSSVNGTWWPVHGDSVVVGDGSLRLQINVLRKALADDSSDPRYIRNVTGPGITVLFPPVAGAAAGKSGAGRKPGPSAPEFGKLPAQQVARRRPQTRPCRTS